MTENGNRSRSEEHPEEPEDAEEEKDSFTNVDRKLHANHLEDEEEGDDVEANTTNVSENGNCRLRRRDTPHHLKGARVNTSNNKAQQLDPNEMKEILERYTNKSPVNSPASVKFNAAHAYQSVLVKPKVDYLIFNFEICENEYSKLNQCF